MLQGCVFGLGQTVDEASSRTPSGNDIGLLFALTRLPDRKLGFALHSEALRKVVGRISIVIQFTPDGGRSGGGTACGPVSSRRSPLVAPFHLH
jgi:hypothetical protein